MKASFKNMIGAIALTLSLGSQASIIDVNTDTGFGTAGQANLQGLEWLSLDITTGLSRTDVEDGFTGTDGNGYNYSQTANSNDNTWRYASREEAEILITSLWDGVFNGWSAGNGVGGLWFLDNFGGLENGDPSTARDYSDGTWTGYDSSNFLFGNAGECNDDLSYSCIGYIIAGENFTGNLMASTVDEPLIPVESYSSNDGSFGYITEDRGLNAGISPENRSYHVDRSYRTIGSLLVRSVSVPEPSIFALMAAGLVGLGFARRTVKK